MPKDNPVIDKVNNKKPWTHTSITHHYTRRSSLRTPFSVLIPRSKEMEEANKTYKEMEEAGLTF